jgi:hypothetical protein
VVEKLIPCHRWKNGMLVHFPQALDFKTRKVSHLASVAAEKEAEAGKPMHQKGP